MTGGRPSAAARVALCVSLEAACLLFTPGAHAQDEGARAYELTPVSSQALNIYGMFARGNAAFNPGAAVSAGAELNLNGGIIEYTHGFGFLGRAGTMFISVPFGGASGSATAGSATGSASSSGIGDMQLTAAFGIAGSPALREEDYATYRPRGVALTLLTRLYIPTGAYDRNSPINLGQNRWAVQVGLPLALYLGESFLDPALTSFELIPSVIGYGDNDDLPHGHRSSQAPLAQLEGHITRNLNQTVWVSLDALVSEGGETSTDGVSDHNRQRSFALGATGSVALSDAVSVTISYTDEVSRNRSGVEGHVLRVIAAFAL